MNLLFFMLLAELPQQKFELPSFLKPVARWADLDGDEVPDIWVRESSADLPETYEIWVHGGTWGSRGFEKLSYTPVPGRVEPIGEAGRFWVQTYIDGRRYEFLNGAWRLRSDYGELGPIRPEMEPQPLGDWELVPGFDGYYLLEEVCQVAKFKAPPTLDVQKSAFRLTWPMPRQADLDKDGQLDLVSAPIRAPQHGEARVWVAMRRGEGWEERTAKLKFPATEKIVGSQFGDLDGDGYPELVILHMSEQDLSVFDELDFTVYSGQKEGGWDPVALQTLKTEQNLWQTGPFEVSEQGITFYYFKGLMNTRFRIDRFGWDAKGYVKPDAKSVSWKLKEGDREDISLDHDFNGDGKTDLLLLDHGGLKIYYRRGGEGMPFEEEPDRVIAHDGLVQNAKQLGIATHIEVSRARPRGQLGRLSGHNRLGLVHSPKGGTPSLWLMKVGNNGTWTLEQHPMPRR